MASEKRERKAPTKFVPFDPKTEYKPRNLQKKKKINCCDYQIIPQPPKLEFSKEIFLLYGNIAGTQQEDQIFFDFSLLNEFHIYLDVFVEDNNCGSKLISITARRNPDKRFSRWKTVINKLSEIKTSSAKKAVKAIKNYSESFETLISDFLKHTKKACTSKEGLNQIESQAKNLLKVRDKTFNSHPSLELRSCLKGSQTELIEIIVTQDFLHLLGYSIDSFASSVLNEGFPQFLHLNFQSELSQSGLASQTELSMNNSIKSCILDATMITKCGYKKSAKIQINSLMNYDQGKYECSTFFIVLEQGLPYLNSIDYPFSVLSEQYLKMICAKENELAQFLWEFYDYPMSLMYSNRDKVCKIRELEFKEET